MVGEGGYHTMRNCIKGRSTQKVEKHCSVWTRRVNKTYSKGANGGWAFRDKGAPLLIPTHQDMCLLLPPSAPSRGLFLVPVMRSQVA